MCVPQDARHAAEAEIYTSLNAKIDQFLQLADYDWMAAVQGGGTLDTSDYLIDLIAFLKSTFSVFTNLPVSTHTHTHTHTRKDIEWHVLKSLIIIKLYFQQPISKQNYKV